MGLKSGDVVETETSTFEGMRLPESEPLALRKFERLTGGRLAGTAQAELLDALTNVERLKDVANIAA